MLISPFTPLFFNRTHRSGGLASRYIQVFAATDRILLEVILQSNEAVPDVIVLDGRTGKEIFAISMQMWEINEEINLAFSEIVLSPGIYAMSIGDYVSDVFRVTEDKYLLEQTTLIQYSMDTNKNRTDAVFVIDGMRRFFDFRVPGGFCDNNWTFSAQTETFSTDSGNLIQLYSLDTTQKQFTLGTCEGCPIWFGEMLNRLLCCNYVYFDGERYCRVESSAPEATQLLEGIDSFIFLQNLQRVTNLDPVIEETNRVIMRRVETVLNPYRAVSSGINRIIK